jgi:hypothetical protein
VFRDMFGVILINKPRCRMIRNVINVVVGLVFVALLGLCGCGGGGGSDGSSGGTRRPDAAVGLITSFGWSFENIAPDFTDAKATCTLSVYLHYSRTVNFNDIESFSVIAPNGLLWTVFAEDIQSRTDSNGDPYIAESLYDSDNPNLMPLAGVWTAELKFKNGDVSSFQKKFHDPGSSVDATREYLNTEDYMSSTPINQAQYIMALKRFPAIGYTVQYYSNLRGEISTTGLSTVRERFLNNEPRAYNMNCWLYDANKVYLGCTIPEYSEKDHSRTNLITTGGDLLILPDSTTSPTGNIVDLSKVKYIRFVYYDGAQFAPSSYSGYDYRSISSLIMVN